MPPALHRKRGSYGAAARLVLVQEVQAARDVQRERAPARVPEHLGRVGAPQRAPQVAALPAARGPLGTPRMLAAARAGCGRAAALRDPPGAAQKRGWRWV